ncbi:hypothetical protein EON65_20230 [archaeon]|nr:MAG: hypothetical protein EON65_20230 [archaeon]
MYVSAIHITNEISSLPYLSVYDHPRAHQETAVPTAGHLPGLPALDFHMDAEIAKATTMLYNFKNALGK